MIALRITVGCDDCAIALAGTVQVRTTTDGLAAARAAGWVVRLSGRLLCPACADPALCRLLGHDFGPAPVWRACACDGSLWEHSTCEPWQDPTSWEGCGWEWRTCRRCDHVDDRHVTQADVASRRADERAADAYIAALERGELRPQPARRNGDRSEHQPGDGILADVAAGLALPHQQNAREETAMVEPNGPRPATPAGGEQR